MRLIYVNTQLDNVNMQQKYDAMQHNNVNMQDDYMYVNMHLELCCMLI